MSKKSKDWQKFKETHDQDNVSFPEEMAELEGVVEETKSLDHPTYQKLEQELTLAEQRANENWEKSLRMAAELKNAERRATIEVENALRFGLAKFVDMLIPVMDSLEQALQLALEQTPSMVEGLELTIKLFLDALQKQGVVQLNPIGELFNPQEHEAMSIQVDHSKEPDVILLVFQKGYKLNDRVIRPARVIVNKA